MLAQARSRRVRWPYVSLVVIATCMGGPAVPAAPKVSTAAPPFAMRALEGPYPSLDAWCKRRHKPCFTDPDEPIELARAPAPWLGARVILTGDVPGEKAFEYTVVNVAIRTKAGWFVGPLKVDSADEGLLSGSLALRDIVPGGGPELVVRYRDDGLIGWIGHDGRLVSEEVCTDRLAFCGLGSSGRPSCTPSLPLREAPCRGDTDGPMYWDWELGIRYVAGGRVAFAPKAGGEPLPVYAKKWVGTHSLVFP